MVIRSPCEQYLKFLLCHPDGYSPADIRAMVRMQQLDFIGMPYLERLKRDMVIPRPFRPDGAYHTVSMRFMRREGITLLFKPDAHMVTATSILSQPRAKELAESMIISRADPSWTCAALKKNGHYATPESIKLYAQYYFNINLVDATDLRTLLELRSAPDGDTRDPDETRIGTTKYKVSRGDQRRISANMGSPEDALLMSMIRLGHLPTGVDAGRLVAATRIISIIQAKESTDRGMPTMGKDYALIAKMMTEIMEQTGDPSKSVTEGIADIKLITDGNKTPHIGELMGEHTLDMQPLGDVEGDEDEHPR